MMMRKKKKFVIAAADIKSIEFSFRRNKLVNIT